MVMCHPDLPNFDHKYHLLSLYKSPLQTKQGAFNLIDEYYGKNIFGIIFIN